MYCKFQKPLTQFRHHWENFNIDLIKGGHPHFKDEFVLFPKHVAETLHSVLVSSSRDTSLIHVHVHTHINVTRDYALA